MKRMLLLGVFGILTGCADTPQNRELWRGIASGMQSAGDSMNQQAAEMRQSLRQQNQQQIIPPVQRPVNCTTRYNSLFKEYETTCN